LQLAEASDVDVMMFVLTKGNLGGSKELEAKDLNSRGLEKLGN
jgi:hypothetical protein